MKHKILIFSVIIFMLSALLSLGCAKRPSAGDKVLASVGNRTITLKDFEARIRNMPPYYRSVVEKNKKKFLDETIAEMLFYEDAVRKRVDKDKEVGDILKEARKKIIITKFIKNEVEDKVKVAEEEIKRVYEANKSEFMTPALWRASHILVSGESEAQEILAELKKGANFEELAKNRSIDGTASRGGDVGYFRLGQVVPEFEKTCLKLNIGETSDIVHTQFGYHIIKLTDKKETSVQTYEDARPAIEAQIRARKKVEAFDDLVMSLKNKYGVRVDEKAFESLGEQKQ